jgi:isopropylmalate/homocitrate/citramalate synthase
LDIINLQALAMGCTGIWCAVCEEGGGMGHSCSITTLVNLARLGNTKVKERYNLPALHRAAVEITKITTGLAPHPRTEVYGAQAMDAIFAAAGDIHLAELIGESTNIRISP